MKGILIVLALLLVAVGVEKKASRASGSHKSRPLFRFLSRCTRCLLGLFAISGTAYGIWGPFWPTGPEAHASDIDSGPPLSLPFTLQNKSAVFSIRVIEIACVTNRIISTTATEERNINVERFSSSLILRPNGHVLFGCDIKSTFPIAGIKYVSLNVFVRYMNELHGVAWEANIYRSETFSWFNGHWTEGPIVGQP